MLKLNNIFTQLNLEENKDLYITSEGKWHKDVSFASRVERLISNKIKPDAFFCFDNKPLILFYEEPTNKDYLYKAIWNFNESPIVIIVDKGAVEILNGFNYLKNVGKLQQIGGSERLSDFTYFKIVALKFILEVYNAY